MSNLLLADNEWPGEFSRTPPYYEAAQITKIGQLTVGDYCEYVLTNGQGDESVRPATVFAIGQRREPLTGRASHDIPKEDELVYDPSSVILAMPNFGASVKEPPIVHFRSVALTEIGLVPNRDYSGRQTGWTHGRYLRRAVEAAGVELLLGLQPVQEI